MPARSGEVIDSALTPIRYGDERRTEASGGREAISTPEGGLWSCAGVFEVGANVLKGSAAEVLRLSRARANSWAVNDGSSTALHGSNTACE